MLEHELLCKVRVEVHSPVSSDWGRGFQCELITDSPMWFNTGDLNTSEPEELFFHRWHVPFQPTTWSIIHYSDEIVDFIWWFYSSFCSSFFCLLFLINPHIHPPPLTIWNSLFLFVKLVTMAESVDLHRINWQPLHGKCALRRRLLRRMWLWYATSDFQCSRSWGVELIQLSRVGT